MRIIDEAATVLKAWRPSQCRLVHQLGIDEHPYRSARWFKDHASSWRRIEPHETGAPWGIKKALRLMPILPALAGAAPEKHPERLGHAQASCVPSLP
jgi:hypothetical protein